MIKKDLCYQEWTKKKTFRETNNGFWEAKIVVLKKTRKIEPLSQNFYISIKFPNGYLQINYIITKKNINKNLNKKRR